MPRNSEKVVVFYIDGKKDRLLCAACYERMFIAKFPNFQEFVPNFDFEVLAPHKIIPHNQTCSRCGALIDRTEARLASQRLDNHFDLKLFGT